MKYEQAEVHNGTVFQMAMPLFQPLRLWTPRVSPLAGGVHRRVCGRPARVPVRAFTIRGGMVNMADGERRMVIAGRIFGQQRRGADVTV
jgi:hypothetical protein